MIHPDFLKAEAIKQNVSKAELEVLSLVVEGHDTKAVAQKLEISPEAVRQRLSQVYQKFQIEGKGPVKLNKLLQLLTNRYQKKQSQTVPTLSSNLSSSKEENLSTRRDWGEVPDVSIFYGRAEELNTLEEWIVKDGCRLVALLGMTGIGKTALSVKLAKQIENKFDYVIWRSLRNAPPLKKLLADWLEILANQQKSDLPEDVNQRVLQLIEYLREHRCLLILDDVETILQSGDRLGRYQQEHKEYEILLREVGQTNHQSCLLLTTQEKPREIVLLESPKQPVRSLLLKGLKLEDAQKILQEQGLTGEEKQQWQDLLQRSQGNPWALKIAAIDIKDLFNGNVAEFNRHHTWVFGEFSEGLDQQFKRFSKLEQEIVCFLANEINSLSIQNLKENIPEATSTSDLMEALASLIRRAWIEVDKSKDKNSQETHYTIPYLFKKYVKKYQLNNSSLM